MLKKIRKRKKTKGQSTLEYAVLVVVVLGALMAVQQYLSRGIQGRAKQATDDISDTQFVPDQTVYTKTVVTASNTKEMAQGGETNSELQGDADETTTTTIDMYFDNTLTP
ncbi:MAG: hypothetical protein P9M07_02105 [Candidatus Aceula meridiana]|nr:hypothetical protein [Candidatus Aceula meridiana]